MDKMRAMIRNEIAGSISYHITFISVVLLLLNFRGFLKDRQRNGMIL